MATFPTFESVLLQIAKALGANRNMTSKSKSKFKYVDMSMDNLSETWESILSEIADALGLDGGVKDDLISNIFFDYQMHKAIELDIYSSKATQRKIIWQYLARVLVPALARHTVFWQIASKMDEGMPGGRFWYLPAVDSPVEPTQLYLPVPQVLDWLIDLIQDSNVTIACNLEDDLRIYDNSGTVLKNLYNWQKAKSTPEISSINNTFPDEVKIQFLGCFEPDEKSPQFEQALVFIEKKGLLPDVLQHEIAINEDDLKRIINTECSVDEEQDFVQKLKFRYQAPSTKTIRRRLLMARAIQEGYDQLVKFLTPTVDKLCIDLNENKALQLVQLYSDVYNRTLYAHLEMRHIDGKLREFAENEYFTENLPHFLRYDLLLAFASDNEQPALLVSNKLNSIFSRHGEEDNLDNILPTSEDDINLMVNVIREEGQQSNNYLIQLQALVEKLAQNKAPYKQLQKMDDFEVVYGAMGHHYPIPKICEMIIGRLNEIETTPEQSMKRILLELEYHLLNKSFDSKTEGKVSVLIEEAKGNDDYECSKAQVLRFEAFHFIAQNKLSDAEKNFNLAIDECKKYSFGKLRGDLARDAFALAIANQKLIPNNHEKYFRDMIHWGNLDGTDKIDIYNVSRELHEYFWESLYKFYPGYKPLFATSVSDFEAFSRDILPCIKSNNPIAQVLKKHKALKKKQLKYPQADSVIMLMMKMSYEMLGKLRYYRQSMPPEVESEIHSVFIGIIKAVREIVQEWPDIVNVSDFKQQTPLMLAAHNKDYETVEVLLKANADTDLRDFTGRTALHSSAASRCLKSASLLLEFGCDGKVVNVDGSTALHTAVRFGEIPIVKLIIEKQPDLLEIRDSNGISPKELASRIASDNDLYQYLNSYFKSEGRTVVSHSKYKQLLDIL
ncbi:ankyrin repeat domain-containing protein [Vibrio furnissii]|uniref:ankyrin repeat domain-containing protein n=1 Tax=Vibrio furnissii TaxID=29494 RepID=UPI0024BA9DBD|nr:ankyrin repeat domain-containing protein [Vibrio furnissii]WHR53210.1 ankyrin repeat domain-containing protein [Vibrio furnissii]